jgi:hypothetical protein
VADADILTPVANGRGMLQEGVSAGFFLAAAPGEAHVTAKLDPCGGPKPGPACDAVQVYQVTVVIR